MYSRHFVFLILEKLDNLSSIIRDLQISVDDATFGLEQYRMKLLESADLINKMKLLHEDTKLNNLGKKIELDFNQVFLVLFFFFYFKKYS